MSALDHTPAEHEHTAKIDLAAQLLRDLPPHAVSQPIVPALQRMFELTAQEACVAIQEARR